MNGSIENPYENFIALSRYARWLPEENRRETWKETVDRYFSFMLNHFIQIFYPYLIYFLSFYVFYLDDIFIRLITN